MTQTVYEPKRRNGGFGAFGKVGVRNAKGKRVGLKVTL